MFPINFQRICNGRTGRLGPCAAPPATKGSVVGSAPATHPRTEEKIVRRRRAKSIRNRRSVWKEDASVSIASQLHKCRRSRVYES